MARFAISESYMDAEKIRQNWVSSGFPCSVPNVDGEVNICLGRKRALNADNFVEIGQNNWILGVGTYITDCGRYGADALELIAGRIDIDNPLDIRKLLIGHYAIAIKVGLDIVVFTDELATFALFYANRDQTFLISTALSDYLLVDDFYVDDASKLFGACHSPSGLRKSTILSGVKRLGGEELIRFSSVEPSRTFHKAKISLSDPEPSHGTIDNALAQYSAASERIFSAIGQFPRIGLNATGGLDSRLIIANAKRHSLEPLLLYGVGNSNMTNTKRGDLKIVKDVASHYGWALYLMDWRQDEPYSEAQRRKINRKYGFTQLYGSTFGVMKELEGGICPYPTLQLGGYNPAFTNSKPWLVENQKYNIEELAERVISVTRAEISDLNSFSRYKKRVVDELILIAEDLGFSPHNNRELTREQFIQIYFESRKNIESENINAYNEFGYYLAPFFTWDVYKILARLPIEWRIGDRFQIMAISKADSRALELPIFSGEREFRLDSQSMTMAAIDDPRLSIKCRNKAKNLLKYIAPGLMISAERYLFQASDVRHRNYVFKSDLLAALHESYPSDVLNYKALSFKHLPIFCRILIINEIIDVYQKIKTEKD